MIGFRARMSKCIFKDCWFDGTDNNGDKLHSKLNPVYVTGYMRTRPFPQAIAGHFYRKLVRVYSCLQLVKIPSKRNMTDFQ